eukprot:gene8234-1500_t
MPAPIAPQVSPLDDPKYGHIRLLGYGAFGIVRLVEDLETKKMYAMKCLKRRRISQRLEAEIVHHSLLRHPHIVQFGEMYNGADSIHILMEYANGGSLLNLLVDEKRLNETRARWYMQQLILAVDYSHQNGIAVRDIKLENCLLHTPEGSKDSVLKICDFGFSIDEDTAATAKAGTVGYMAPEILKGGIRYDPKASDVFSMGVVLYIMLYGKYPFDVEGAEKMPAYQVTLKMLEVIENQTYDLTPSVEVSDGCKKLLEGMLRPNPAERIGMSEILRDPWFNEKLPKEAQGMNAHFLAQPLPKDHQTVASVQEELEKAKAPVIGVARKVPSPMKQVAHSIHPTVMVPTVMGSMHLPESDKNDGKPAIIGRRLRMSIDAGAGALAGCVARFMVSPLDVIKIRFQVQLEPISMSMAGSKYTGFFQALKTIFKEEGIQGLWRGTVPGLLLTVPYTAVQFVAMQQCKDYASSIGISSQPNVAPLVSFVSGGLAGSAATIASYPFDLLRTRLAAQGEPKIYRNMLDAGSSIVRAEGFRGLYRGLNITLIEIIPYAALQFGLYDAFTGAWRRQVASSRTRLEEGETSAASHSDSKLSFFVCGLMAGMCSKFATHPLDVAKKRFQVAGLQRALSYGARIESDYVVQSLRESLVGIFRNEGMRGLWKGCAPNLIKAAPASAITFTAYEAIREWMSTMAVDPPPS